MWIIKRQLSYDHGPVYWTGTGWTHDKTRAERIPDSEKGQWIIFAHELWERVEGPDNVLMDPDEEEACFQ